MLLRICLVLAILAGAGVIAVSHFKVRPHIEGIIAERETNKQNWKREETRANKLQANLKQTEAKLAETEKTLEDTKGQLTAMTSKANMLEGRVNDLAKTLDETKKNLSESQQKLSRYELTGLTVEQIIALGNSAKGLQTANAGLIDENKVLLRENKRLDAKVKYYEGDKDVPPTLPPGLKGKVLVFDPKWNFVVLDIGEIQGVAERGEMMVTRNSKLIAKIKIVNVQPQRSIANIMPGWKLGEVMEGDLVIH